MATTKQKTAARKNIKKAQAASKRGATKKTSKRPRTTSTLSTAEKNELPKSKFAFPEQRKEPLTDARHVRNAIARFDQVEGVTDADRDRAWKRIKTAANKYDVEISESSWHELFEGGKTKKR